MLGVEAAFSFGINIASALFLAAAGRVAREALGEEQERELKDVFDRASAAMLVELARGDIGNLVLLERYKREFGTFFSDPWVAQTLVGVALDRQEPPVERLRARFSSMGFDPDGLTIGFGRAIAVFVRELLERLERNASEGGSLEPLVSRADLSAIRDRVDGIARGLGDTGQDVDELERESLARCAERWEAAGLSAEEAHTLAADPAVGAPGADLASELSRRAVSVLAGEVGAGKSLTLDRMLQRAIKRLREEPGAPLPVRVEAWEVEGRLRDAVVERTRSLGGSAGDVRTRGAYVLVDGAEEEGSARAARLVKEARILAGTWPNTTVVVAGRPLPELAEDRERLEVPELSEDESYALIDTITGEVPAVAVTHRWPESVKEAIRRPLFAVLVASDMRERGSYNPRSTGEMLTALVERALRRSGNAVSTTRLRELAVAVMGRGGTPVPPRPRRERARA